MTPMAIAGERTAVDEAAEALVRVAQGRPGDIDFMMLGQGFTYGDLFDAATRITGEQARSRHRQHGAND